MGVTTWSDEAVAVLQEHFATETATQIAERLAGIGQPFSRSAIIGKASRLGLYIPKQNTGDRRPRGPNKLPAKPKVKKSNIRSWNASYGNPVSAKATPPVFVDLEPEVGQFRLLDLEPHHCRYTTDRVTFCGEHKSIFGGSYCDQHAFQCYQVWPPGVQPTLNVVR